ncbi:hypothetical protein JNB_04690 [Janibacter sp. HTCC2649]|nr:hypothetical protein JNB_04690 [Janibacter sp. HTCC2649]
MSTVLNFSLDPLQGGPVGQTSGTTTSQEAPAMSTNTNTTKASTVTAAKKAAAKANASAATKAAASAPTQNAQKAPKATTAATPAKTPQNADAPMWANVKFYRLRKVGTARHLPYFAPGTPERKDAEKVASLVAKGKSASEVAEATERSVSTVRRLVAAVQLAQDVESGQYDNAIVDGKVVLPAREETK